MLNQFLENLYRRLWLLIVILPVALVAVFQVFFAEEEFEVTASVIIKENQQSAGPSFPGVAAALFDYGNNTSVEDAYILREYLHSEAFIEKLSNEFDLFEHYAENGFPFIQRLEKGADLASVSSYMAQRARAKVSTETSILTISIRSFDSVFSKRLADFVLVAAEQRINDMSSRIADSKMALAIAEFDKAETSFRDAKLGLLEFQTSRGFLDSEKELGSRFAELNNLRALILTKTVELETMKQRLRGDSLAVRNLQDEVSVLEAQLAKMEKFFLGDVANGSVAVASEFNRVSLNVEFELNKYTSALAALQQAQLEASKQQKFLLVVAPPIVLEDAVYPSPLTAVFSTLVVCTLVCLLLKLVIATVRDHTI